MASEAQLPKTMRALVLRSTSEPPKVERVPTPEPVVGSAVVRVLATSIISYTRDVYNGKRNYPFPTPLIVGTSAIARVVAIPVDSTKLRLGDLVHVDCMMRSRDDPDEAFLIAFHEGYTLGSQKLMRQFVRDWSHAEYCLAPLENLAVLDEKRLTGNPGQGGLGYRIEELALISELLIPYGGLHDIGVQAGQTVIVAPATGPFGWKAVLIALALGARVIAMGRNVKALEVLKSEVPYPERVETVPITGSVAEETAALQSHGQIDAFFDIGPPEAYASTHIKSAILALRHGAKISLMGGYKEDVAIPHVWIMHRNMRLYGKWMYERTDVADMIKMVETGALRLGQKGGLCLAGEYPLEEWKEAWDHAAEEKGFGRSVVVTP